MTKKMIFVSRIGSSYFLFLFLFSFYVALLGTDIDSNVSIETHMKYGKLLILKKKKVIEGPI